MTNPSSLWLSDPAWSAMDATARGFHTQLVLLAAQSQGVLPDDETLWRRWLGIPEPGASPAATTVPAAVVQWVNQGTPNRLAQLGGMAGLTEHYWVSRWLPMVRAAWTKAGEGQVTCRAARAMADVRNSLPEVVAEAASPVPEAPAAGGKATKKTARKRATKAPKTTTLMETPLEHLVGWDGPLGEGWAWIGPMGERLFDTDQVKARWHVPASRATRLNLWTVGLAALSSGPGEEGKNRSFLAGLIKTYGERKVSAALGEISARAIPPADPRAFLRAILRRETEGTVAAQQAREERASIPL